MRCAPGIDYSTMKLSIRRVDPTWAAMATSVPLGCLRDGKQRVGVDDGQIVQHEAGLALNRIEDTGQQLRASPLATGNVLAQPVVRFVAE